MHYTLRKSEFSIVPVYTSTIQLCLHSNDKLIYYAVYDHKDWTGLDCTACFQSHGIRFQ